MKKKVLYGVTLALFGCASMVSLQSCKDDLSDLEHRMDYEMGDQSSRLQDLWNKTLGQGEYDDLPLADRIDALEEFRNGLDELDPNGFKAAFENLSGDVDDLKDALYGVGGSADNPTAGGLLKDFDDLQKAVMDEETGLGALWAQVNDDENGLGALWDLINNPEEGIEARLEALELWKNGLKIPNDMEPRVQELENKMTVLQGKVEALEKKVKALENLVNAYVKALTDRLDDLITDILIQRAYGPVFGDFSLPIGVQSNMLFNWYPENINQIDKFPTNTEDITFDSSYVKDFVMGGDESDMFTLGRLYLTINPVNVKAENEKYRFSLVNSFGDALPIELKPEGAVEEEDLLTFGSTRASDKAAGNGFYKAEVKIPYANVEEVMVNVDKKGLEDIAKSVAKDPSLASAAKLLKAVYDQVNQKLPAYAVRCDWTTTSGKDVTVNVAEDNSVTSTAGEETYGVVSKYELAVATARPLSFNSLKGISSDKTIPTVGNLDNFIEELKKKTLDKINVNAETSISYNGDTYKVAIKSISFRSDNDKLFADVEGMTVNGAAVNWGNIGMNPKWPTLVHLPNPNGNFSVECNGVDTAIDDLNSGLVAVLCIVTGNEEQDFEAQAKLKLNSVLIEMNNQINKIVEDLKGNVGSIFDSASGSSYFNRVNKVFELYNKVAGKLNKVLANPNAALQVAAFYEGNNGIYLLSQKENSATQVKGGSNMTVYLTSYTGEILAPAYKKFFAFADPDMNNGKQLGKVLDGTVTDVTFKVPTEPGKYELLYQAVDYSGYTSTKKFYIEVK